MILSILILLLVRYYMMSDAMYSESEFNSKMQKQKNALEKQIRKLITKNALRKLQNQYDSKMIKALYKKNRELHQEIVKELKPDFEKMEAEKKAIFDDIERLKKTGRWIKTKKGK